MSIKNLVEMIKRNGLLASMPQLEELYQVAIENELKLAESQREFRAADATIENLQMQVEKLAAEVQAAKAAIPKFKDIEFENDNMDDVSIAEDVGFNDAVTLMNRWMPETPATDAFLAEVRAQGVEMFAAWNDKHIKKGVEHKESLTAVSHAARGLAEQIRKGVQS